MRIALRDAGHAAAFPSVTAPSPPNSPRATHAALPPYLIVDDSEAARFQLRKCLQAVGEGDTRVQEASAIPEALQAAREQPFDAVFLDLVLGSGQVGQVVGQVLRPLLKDDPSLAVIVVTGLPADHPHIVDAISNGAFAYVPKPVRLDAVRRVIADLQAERSGMTRIL